MKAYINMTPKALPAIKTTNDMTVISSNPKTLSQTALSEALEAFVANVAFPCVVASHPAPNNPTAIIPQLLRRVPNNPAIKKDGDSSTGHLKRNRNGAVVVPAKYATFEITALKLRATRFELKLL